MTFKHLLAGALLCVFIGAPLSAEETSKWFVLRNHEVGNCWTATLIRIDAQYINTFEQKAGGPYETQARALDRQKSLENEGTCNRD
jgi:hypothetical protein